MYIQVKNAWNYNSKVFFLTRLKIIGLGSWVEPVPQKRSHAKHEKKISLFFSLSLSLKGATK